MILEHALILGLVPPEKAAAILSRANELQETDDYKRLRTTLLERGVIDC